MTPDGSRFRSLRLARERADRWRRRARQTNRIADQIRAENAQADLDVLLSEGTAHKEHSK
jgi:hypothetical protein